MRNLSELRITNDLLLSIQNDLARPHDFAWERVGFLFCKVICDGKILLATSYQSLIDEAYIPDSFVGARFDGTAIRQARQYSMDNGESILHIHAHDGFGKPHFSHVDLKCLREMVPSFISVSPKLPHGAVVLSNDRASGLLWHPDGKVQAITDIRSIGFHSKILNGDVYEKLEI